jgi:hypothetical protein
MSLGFDLTGSLKAISEWAHDMAQSDESDTSDNSNAGTPVRHESGDVSSSKRRTPVVLTRTTILSMVHPYYIQVHHFHENNAIISV